MERFPVSFMFKVTSLCCYTGYILRKFLLIEYGPIILCVVTIGFDIVLCYIFVIGDWQEYIFFIFALLKGCLFSLNN